MDWDMPRSWLGLGLGTLAPTIEYRDPDPAVAIPLSPEWMRKPQIERLTLTQAHLGVSRCTSPARAGVRVRDKPRSAQAPNELLLQLRGRMLAVLELGSGSGSAFGLGLRLGLALRTHGV